MIKATVRMLNITRKIVLKLTYAFIFFILFLCSSCDKSSPIQPDEEVIVEVQWPPYLNKSFVMGRFEPRDHEQFIQIEDHHASRTGLFLHKEAYAAFTEMFQQAAVDGVDLKILSATRNFDYQKRIWDHKWTGETTLSDGTKATQIEDPELRARKILLYSSMPGTSRHHWGTDIDLNNFNNEYFSIGKGKEEYEWLVANAHKYGYCQPYSSKSSGRTGYEEEKWHWSYTPLSKVFTSFYEMNVSNAEIDNSMNNNLASTIDMLENFVLGIAPVCRPNEK